VRYKIVPPQLEPADSPEKTAAESSKPARAKSKVRERLEQQAALRRGAAAATNGAGAGADEDTARKEFLRASSRMRRIPLPKTKLDYSTVPAKTDSKAKQRVRVLSVFCDGCVALF
jgi:hypothetical protein